MGITNSADKLFGTDFSSVSSVTSVAILNVSSLNRGVMEIVWMMVNSDSWNTDGMKC